MRTNHTIHPLEHNHSTEAAFHVLENHQHASHSQEHVETMPTPTLSFSNKNHTPQELSRGRSNSSNTFQQDRCTLPTSLLSQQQHVHSHPSTINTRAHATSSQTFHSPRQQQQQEQHMHNESSNSKYTISSSSSFSHGLHTCMGGSNNNYQHMYLPSVHETNVYNNTMAKTTTDHDFGSETPFHSSMLRPSTLLSNSTTFTAKNLTNRDDDGHITMDKGIQQVQTANQNCEFSHDSIFPDLSNKDKQKSPIGMSIHDTENMNNNNTSNNNTRFNMSSNSSEDVLRKGRRASFSYSGSGGSGAAASSTISSSSSPPYYQQQSHQTPPPPRLNSEQQQQQGIKRPNGQQAHITMTTITFEELSMYFDWKLEHACEAIGISSTSMKKLCRHFNIPRWPYRKLRSLYIKKEKILENMKSNNSKKLEQQLAQVDGEIERVKTPSRPSAAYQLNNSNTSGEEESGEENSDQEIDTSQQMSKKEKKKTPVYRRSVTPSTPPVISQSSYSHHESRCESISEQQRYLSHSPTLRKSPPETIPFNNSLFRPQAQPSATSSRVTNSSFIGDNNSNFPVYANPPLHHHSAYHTSSTSPPLSHPPLQQIKPSEIPNPFSSSNSSSAKLPSIHDLLKDFNTKREY
ncbi:hypothetical protein FDP41_008193 [Naegleria fowleri]|uniref:RWP-RK domain-containing protein n=1 Tax=Naegleria fowleri TaxID=5763 RepID=A0A6A5BKU2_NAEFO|nr:uncharacterized protein FDP41_008193 [Naegleria fowleri]KAF0973489.1 hypothetical protein FDP41_008193 [Naegleria fowleri]